MTVTPEDAEKLYGKHFVRDPRRPQYNAHTSEMRKLIGRSPERLGPESSGPHNVQGIEVRVRGADERGPKEHKRSHRVMAKCPDCGREMSAGRLHQHAKVHR